MHLLLSDSSRPRQPPRYTANFRSGVHFAPPAHWGLSLSLSYARTLTCFISPLYRLRTDCDERCGDCHIMNANAKRSGAESEVAPSTSRFWTLKVTLGEAPSTYPYIGRYSRGEGRIFALAWLEPYVHPLPAAPTPTSPRYPLLRSTQQLMEGAENSGDGERESPPLKINPKWYAQSCFLAHIAVHRQDAASKMLSEISCRPSRQENPVPTFTKCTRRSRTSTTRTLSRDTMMILIQP
jgi:hypothetical protein